MRACRRFNSDCVRSRNGGDVSDVVTARVTALAPEQLSLLVLRLRDQVRRVVAPPPPMLAGNVDINRLPDSAVDEMLAQLVAADGEAATALVSAAGPEPRSVDVNELSDDEVTNMLTILLAEDGE
jgi:NAD(P)-dependent dehydrogenase (short-subunit alcohol dehydrogenase family)